MSHLGYIGAAYAIFVIILLWDYVAPRVKLAQVRRTIRQRVRRDAAKSAKETKSP